MEDTVVNDIMARQAHGEFPEVLPSEALTLGDITASVDDVLDWGKKIEHVLIQSYINQRYQEYREEGHVFEESEAVIRAKWARDCYYVHLSKFWELQQSTGSIITEAFSKLVPLDEVPADEAAEVRKLLVEIGDSSSEQLVIHVRAEWDKMWSSLPAFFFAIPKRQHRGSGQ